MRTLDKYAQRLLDFTNSYSADIPDIVEGIAEKKAKWSDPVWYITNPNTGLKTRYILTKCTFGLSRSKNDSKYLDRKKLKEQLLSEPLAKLLKIYLLAVELKNIASDSKQTRVRVAAQILTEASIQGGLHAVQLTFWQKIKLSNQFWDFCKKNRLVPGSKRPVHKDRSRDTDDAIELSNKRLKMTPKSLIVACGDIFQRIFKDVDDDGFLSEGGTIDIPDAMCITAVLLGLASPSRLMAETPLLRDQLLKTIQPKTGDPVNYLDWPGSKGYSDNKNHILEALAPQVKKAIGFFHYTFKPDRYFVRFLKNTKQNWREVLNGFEINPERKAYIDLDAPPNIFTVAYALGLYPVNYKVPRLKEPDRYIATSKSPYYKYNLNIKNSNKKLKKPDLYEWIHIAKVKSDHVFTKQKGTSKYNGIHALLNVNTINESKWKELDLPQKFTAADAQNTIIRIQKKYVVNFPFSHVLPEKQIDLEHALFCYAPGRHRQMRFEGLAGSPLQIVSLTKIKNRMEASVMTLKNSINTNIFLKYGFGFQRLRFHSLRHFSNTQAEKSGIPLAVIAAWSGRVSVNQTLEYIHTSEKEKSERLIATLDLEDSEKDIRYITNEELRNFNGLPASTTETGICVQELAVTPCNYMNDFLSGCFGCESACYICGDANAIDMLKRDLQFQKVRLAKMEESRDRFISEATKAWWVKHSQGISLLEQLISILEEHKFGQLVRISGDRKCFYLSDLNNKTVEEKKLSLPSKHELLEKLETKANKTEKVPDSMKSLIAAFGLME